MADLFTNPVIAAIGNAISSLSGGTQTTTSIQATTGGIKTTDYTSGASKTEVTGNLPPNANFPYGAGTYTSGGGYTPPAVQPAAAPTSNIISQVSSAPSSLISQLASQQAAQSSLATQLAQQSSLTSGINAAIPGSISQSQLDTLRQQGIDVFNPKTLRELNAVEKIQKQLTEYPQEKGIQIPQKQELPIQQQVRFNQPTESFLNRLSSPATNIPLRVSSQNIYPKLDSTIITNQAASKYYEAGFNPYQSLTIVKARIEKAKTEYENKGYLPQQAETLARYDIANSPVLNQTSANKLLATYEKQHPLSTLGQYAFGSAGQTQQDFLRQQQDQLLLSQPYSKLITSGNVPTAVRKAAYEAGTEFFKTTSSILGTKQNLSSEQLKAGGQELGNLFLFSAVTPVIKTASYGEAFQQLNPVKSATKKTETTLGTNRFSGLGEGLDAEAKAEIANKIINKVSKDLLNKPNAVEQTKYLNELAGKLKTPEDKAAFKSLVQELYAQGFYKGVPLDIYTGKAIASPSIPTISYYGQSLPQLNNIGIVAGVTAAKIQSNQIKIPVSPALVSPTTPARTLTTDTILSLSKVSTSQANIPSSISRVVQKEIPKQTPTFRLSSPQIPKEIAKEISLSKSSLLNPSILKKGESIPPRLQLTRGGSAMDKLLRKISKSYLAITKRRGREVILGEYKTPEQAQTLSALTARESLAASVIVREKQTGKQISLLNPNQTLFTQSKRNPLTLVQKRGTRLGSSGERKEIQQARKNVRSFAPLKKSLKPGNFFSKRSSSFKAAKFAKGRL